MAELTRLLANGGYDCLLAVEIDHLHPDYGYDEHAAARQSIVELRRLAGANGSAPSARPLGTVSTQRA